MQTSRQMYSPAGEAQLQTVSKVPLVETQTRTVAYEARAEPEVDACAHSEQGQFVGSQAVSTQNRTVETVTVRSRAHPRTASLSHVSLL